MGFDVAADAYDSFMGRYSTGLAPQMADLAGIRGGQVIGATDKNGAGPHAIFGEWHKLTRLLSFHIVCER